jgi:hypothetical protein
MASATDGSASPMEARCNASLRFPASTTARGIFTPVSMSPETGV